MKKIFLLVSFFAIVLFILLRPHTASITNTLPQGVNIIAFGDSLSYGTGAKAGMDYPSQLSSLLKRPIINLGVPGDTTAMALQRIDKVLTQQPRIVLITLGGNDFLRKIPKQTASENLKTIIQKIQNAGALVVIGGIDVPIFGRGINRFYKKLALDTGSLLVPNIYQGIMGHPALMSDPIHPNGQGYHKMAEHFYAAIKPYTQ